MSKQVNYTFNIYLRFIGLVATTVQVVQFFNGLWDFETWIEVSMLILFLALAISPTKYLDKIVEAIASKIKGKTDTLDDIDFNARKIKPNSGGELPSNDEEV